MARESAAVYRRRRVVALIVLLVPVALILRACAGSGVAPEPTPSASPTVSASLETPTARAKATETATATPTPTKSAKPKIPDCANSAIEVAITADAESYAIGSPVTMAMRITNVGDVACKRDVGALANEVYVTDVDGSVVWSSDACQTDAKPQVVTMGAGAVFGNTQVWGGSNTGRDCTSAAADAVAGSYLAYARNDSVVSKPFAFTIQ